MEKKFKLITFIDRINFISDKFISYYSNIFNKDEFHFLINSKTSEHVGNYLIENGFNQNQFQKINRESYGVGEIVWTQNLIQKRFINQGFIVIYVDIDEFIYHKNLKSYIISSKQNHFCPRGFQIFQNLNETELDINKTIFSQREYYKPSWWYSKICILKTPHQWTSGRHNKYFSPSEQDEFYLFDISKSCKKIFFENNVKTFELYDKLNRNYVRLTEKNLDTVYKSKLSNLIKIPEKIKLDINL